MHLARLAVGEEIRYAAVVDGPDGTPEFVLLDTDPFRAAPTPVAADAPRLTTHQVTLLPPVPDTAKVVGIGRNYAGTVTGAGESPLFLKPGTAIVGPGGEIVQPAFSDDIHFEAELAVVIGRTCHRVAREQAADHILGYTCANDVTARDAQRTDGQWTRAKGFDTSCPLGPWIVTDLDVTDLRITAHRNGLLVQDGRTSQMLLDVAGLIERVSAVMTLRPGDVLLTGTPVGAGPITVGDRIEISIESVGSLSNPVTAALPADLEGSLR